VNPWLERGLVACAVGAAALYALKVLLPFGWRVAIARRLAGRVPDAWRIWIAGRHGCEACGVQRPGLPRR